MSRVSSFSLSRAMEDDCTFCTEPPIVHFHTKEYLDAKICNRVIVSMGAVLGFTGLIIGGLVANEKGWATEQELTIISERVSVSIFVLGCLPLLNMVKYVLQGVRNEYIEIIE